MTPAEIVAIAISIVGPIAGFLIVNARASARNDITAQRVEKLELLLDRVTKLEAADGEYARRLDRHFLDDMQALDRIVEQIRDGRRETLDAIAAIRADVRSMMGHEDTDVRRRRRGSDDAP